MDIISVVTGLGQALAAPLVRNIGGWAKNAFTDGEVSPYEWKQLGETVVSISIITIFVYFGWNGLVGDVNILAAGMSAALIDMILSAWKKKKK